MSTIRRLPASSARAISVKRCKLPFTIESACPQCGQAFVVDLTAPGWYLSYPTPGKVVDVGWCCDDCDLEIEVKAVFDVTLTLVGDEDTSPVRVHESMVSDHTCPDCGWSGSDSALIEKLSGRLCPSCSRVLMPGGGLRLSAVVKPVAEEEGPTTLAEGWCSACQSDLRSGGAYDGPIRQSKSYDSPHREWACPECGHTEDDSDLTLEDLQDVMVEGWEMPEPPEDGAVPRAVFSHDSKLWLLIWTTEDDWGPCWHGFIIPWPFHEGVEVTADMLRVLGFTMEGA